MSNEPSERTEADTDSFPQREAAARRAMIRVAREIASSPQLKSLADHLGAEALDLMLEGHTQVLADLITQDPEVFRQPPMDQLNDHAFNILIPHMSRKEQIAFGRTVVEQVTGKQLKD